VIKEQAFRVLIAPDKFKGSLTAEEVAGAISEGLLAVGEADVRTAVLPLADGGDGSVAAALNAGFAGIRTVVSRPDGARTDSMIAFDGHTAVVEVANTSGLAMMAGRLDALGASSAGTGQAIRTALSVGATRVVVGLGGSATTDGGAGVLTALGARFRTSEGELIEPTGGTLTNAASLDLSDLVALEHVDIVGASDVRAPLLGAHGTARIYAPQKGADAADIETLERNLEHLVRLVSKAGIPRAHEIAANQGAGSAGGIGFALAILGGRLVSGADFFLDLLDFDDRVSECDLVVTGEGSLDAQTADGKLISVVAARAKSRPVVAIAGRSDVTPSEAKHLGLDAIYALADLTDEDTARDRALSLALVREIAVNLATSWVRRRGIEPLTLRRFSAEFASRDGHGVLMSENLLVTSHEPWLGQMVAM